MSWSPAFLNFSNKARLISLALFLLMAQVFVVGHSAQFGNLEHHHDGEICTLVLYAHSEDECLAAPASTNVPAPELHIALLEARLARFLGREIQYHSIRAPPYSMI